MRARGILIAAVALVLPSVLLTGVGGADLVDVKILLAYTPDPMAGMWRIHIEFYGTASEQDSVYAPNSSFVESHESTFYSFEANCTYLVSASRVRPGYNPLCDASKGFAQAHGSVTYQSFNEVTGDEQSCIGKATIKQGVPWYIGGNLAKPNLMNAQSGPPLIDSEANPTADNLVVTSSDPSLGCTALSLENPNAESPTGDYGQFRLSRLMPFPGRATNHWSLPISHNLMQGSASFDGHMRVDVDKKPKSPPTAGAGQVQMSFEDWWNSRLESLPPGSYPVDLPPGFLHMTWTSGGSGGHALRARSADQPRSGAGVLLTVHQSLHAGLNALAPQLTALGQEVLAGTASAPTITSTITFTPVHGSAVTTTETFTPVVVPAITSVQFTGGPANPGIVVRGRGLTPLPPQNPAGSPAGHNGCPAESGQTGSDYGLSLQINDSFKNWAAGFSIPTATSCIGLIVTKATPGEVDLRLGSFYSQYYPKFTLAAGDRVQVTVSGASITVHVAYGAPVTS